MRHVFLSYAHENSDRAKRLRTLLWEQSWHVFWDRNLKPGLRWDQQLDEELRDTCCVVVLWGNGSKASAVQFDEANHALSQQKLILVLIDDEELPLGLRPVQWLDLRGWTGDEDHTSLTRLYAAVARAVEAAQVEPQRIGEIPKELAGKPDTADRHSVSNRKLNLTHILAAVRDADGFAAKSIAEGYDKLASAHKLARLALDDAAPRNQYKEAALHFDKALRTLTEDQKRRCPAGANRPVEYFLRMEHANALVFSGGSADSVPKEAFDTYERLSELYPDDTAVWLRLGRARVKEARYSPEGETKRVALMAAVRDLNKALSVAPFDEQVDPDHWVYYEAPLQIGICFWAIAEFPGLPPDRRIASLQQAITHTHMAVVRPSPKSDPDGFVQFVKLRAAGNIIFYASIVLREAITGKELRERIREYADYLRTDDAWPVVENQVRIIDSILYGAVTIGDRTLAAQMARLNASNFKKISLQRVLDGDEAAMAARCEEVAFMLGESATAAPRLERPT